MIGTSASPHIITSQRENELLQLIHSGPANNVGNQFEQVLTVPLRLRQRIFYWPEEREFCEHVSSIGKALDTLTAVHTTFVGQFKVLSNLRVSFIQAPTEYFVAPMYFCDRALDSLLRSTRKVQNGIGELFKDLGALESECLSRYRWTKKAFLEDKYPKDIAAHSEPGQQPDMEIKEQRVELLAELNDRIGMVRRGGNSVFHFVGRQWLPGYVRDIPLCRPDVVMIPSVDADTPQEEHQEDPSAEKGSGTAQMVIEDSESLATPVQQPEGYTHSQQTREGNKAGEVPETPEVQRTGGIMVTQRSSPRKRKPSQSCDGTEDTENPEAADFIARSLIRDSLANLHDSPAQKSGASIEAMKAVSQRAVAARVAGNQLELDEGRGRNMAKTFPLGTASNRHTSRKKPLSDAREVLHNPSQDLERDDEEKPRSLSI